MNRFIKILLSLSLLTVFLNAKKSQTENTGDILQVLIPLSAYGTTFYLDDEEGRDQFYRSFFATFLTTHYLKRKANRLRPDKSNHESFPSGHTSAAFQGAVFIHYRYGFTYSILPYIAASYVGHSRMKANKHYRNDVIAGAFIGVMSNHIFVKKYNKNVLSVQPAVISSNTYGVQIKYSW